MVIKKIAFSIALVVGALSVFSSAASEPGDVVLSFAVLGDAEPKPKPEFPNVDDAVRQVNDLVEELSLDFVVGVGDIAHKGTMVQYENVTPVLQKLKLPFYPIMGNEEHGSTVERYLEFANKWNEGKTAIESTSYVKEFDSVALVFSSPDYDRDFNDSGIDWTLKQIKRLHPKPVLLIVHGAQAGAYPEVPDKGITHPGFKEVVEQPNLAAVISGDLHMDMDRVNHYKEVDGVHYLHIPALERTKIPDESRHIPMFRVFEVHANGDVVVETYQLAVEEPLERHVYEFKLGG
ncbi:MAG: metallophosphoesterase [Imperialibacter sp.]